jgi:wobble nucleotide-excising tRNase
MIVKFEKISSVGRFRDFTAKGDVCFKDFTLIYADNGSGKTTLASILRSLSKSDETIIRNRLSTNHTLDQSIQIFINDNKGTKNTYTFGKNGWKNTIDNFEIFDAHFVNENIYSGFEISDVHKKKLHQFVIGNQGIAIKNKILKNKQDKEAKKIEIDELVKSLIKDVGFGIAENELNIF